MTNQSHNPANSFARRAPTYALVDYVRNDFDDPTLSKDDILKRFREDHPPSLFLI